MKSGEHGERNAPSAPQRNLVSDDVARTVAAHHLVDAQLGSLTKQLNEIPEFKREPASRTNSLVRGLVARRSELLARHVEPKHHMRLPRDAAVLRLADLFGPWNVLNLPYFSEGISNRPEESGTSGDITTLGLFPGGLAYGGTPTALVPVSGSIAVAQGKSAALGFIYGTIVSAASGFVQFLWANFGTRQTVPSHALVGPGDFDKLEYRFEPDWWIRAVANRLEPTA